MPFRQNSCLVISTILQRDYTIPKKESCTSKTYIGSEPMDKYSVHTACIVYLISKTLSALFHIKVLSGIKKNIISGLLTV